MNGRTTSVAFGDERFTTAEPLFQYDYGQRIIFTDLTLPEPYEVHFSNGIDSQSKTVIGTSEGVLIPDEYLRTGRNVLCWIFLHDTESDGETEYMVRIPVRPRASITEEPVTPEAHDAISDLTAMINEIQLALNGIHDQIEAMDARLIFVENRVPGLDGWANPPYD